MSAVTPYWIMVLGAALVHFLWQAALVGLVLAALQPLLRRRTAAARYLIYCLALFALPVMFAATIASVAASRADGLGWLPQLSGAGLHQALLTAFPYLVAVWVTGVSVLGLRAVGGLALAQRLRRGVDENLPAAWRASLSRLRAQLGVRLPVRLSLSAAVPGPCVVGGWRPLILLPLSALTAVPVEQIEALLAHELAHIRRHDYLVNLVQRGVEVVFFFHPAVWWISRQVREERELCCDDLAVAACGDRLAYARALVGLAQWRTQVAQVAMAAGGGSLGQRVRRIVELAPGASRGAGLAAAGMLLLALTGLLLAGLPPSAVALPALPGAPAPVALAQMVSLELPPQPPAVAAAKPAWRPPPAQAAPAAATKTVTVAWVMTQRLEEVQACGPQLAVSQTILPSGLVWTEVRTVTRCVPVLQPVEVWVPTIT